ncbi:UNVERIFIED_CONTAM: putative chloride channel-like protein CLC-g [Sesamum calycinum]|uniref:Chloride channel-like protein CLC-g n=1 Tax=Sesamum calycinum TaxID=2727403 RepID=A0AAW2N1A2_9LAMI
MMLPAIPNGMEPAADEESSEPLLLLQDQRSRSNTTSQVAIVGSDLCPIESLDYEIIENDFFKQDWRTMGTVSIFQYIFMKWTLCFLIGVIVSLLGFLNNLAIENIAGVKFVITSNMMLARKFVVAFIVFASSNLGLTFLSSLVTALIAPEAAGSGIPEVKAYLNGVDAPAIFSFRTLVVKIVGSILAVSSSLNVGKAGPMVHTGACVAAIMGQGGSKKSGLTCKWLQVLKNDRDRRDLVTCGSAAGIAAAFRAPVGGVLFALEEMASWWRSALLWRAFFTTAVVAIVLRALIDVCLRGECGLFGKGGLIMYDVTSANISYHLRDVPAVLLLAVIGGLLGSQISFSTLRIIPRYKFKGFYIVCDRKGIAYRILLACFISISTSCLLFGLPWIASCRLCPSDASEPCPTIGRSGNYKKFQCPPGYYNDLASLFFNTNDDAIKNLFSKGTDTEFHHSSMLIFFATCFFLSTFSYGIVAPTGLFVPVIVTGAAYGRFVGMCVGSNLNLNHGLFAVLGSASLLGGSMRMTVSLCVIILELTDNLLLLPLIMLVLLISKTVADAHFRFSMASRSHLVTLLRKKLFFKTPTPVGLDAFLQFSADDFTTKDLGHCDQIDDIELSEEEMEMFVDLHPFTNTSPYTVVETMSLAKALILFREVGLRHLLVIPKVSGSPYDAPSTLFFFLVSSKLQGLSNNGIRLPSAYIYNKVVSGMLDLDLAKKLK